MAKDGVMMRTLDLRVVEQEIDFLSLRLTSVKSLVSRSTTSTISEQNAVTSLIVSLISWHLTKLWHKTTEYSG